VTSAPPGATTHKSSSQVKLHLTIRQQLWDRGNTEPAGLATEVS